jgi:hypothetical protein
LRVTSLIVVPRGRMMENRHNLENINNDVLFIYWTTKIKYKPGIIKTGCNDARIAQWINRTMDIM